MQFAEAKSLETILNEIVVRVRKFTNADGTAVAIRDGDFVVTRATTGGIAPDLGARMSIRGSFTGSCLVERKVLHCEDSDTDARVDAATCRQLNTRSFVVVPFEGTSGQQGVLAAFSSAPHAFTRTDIAVVKTAADQIRQALSSPTAEPGAPLPVERAVDKKSEPESILKARLAELLEPSIPAEESAAASSASSALAAAAVPTKVAERTTSVATPARIEAPPATELLSTQQPAVVSLAEAIEAPAKPEPVSPQPLDEQLPDGFREQYLGWKGFDTQEPAPRSTLKWILAAGAACVLLVGIIAFSIRGSFSSLRSASGPTPHVTTTRAEAPEPTSSQPTPVPVATPAVTPPLKSRTATQPVEAATRSTVTSAVPERTALVVAESSSPKPRAPEIPEAEAPQVSIASSAALLPDVKLATAGAPKPPSVKVSNLEPSELTYKVVPRFPTFTNAPPGVQTVVLRARVLVDGSVGDVQVLQGRPEFGDSARAAVKQWRYKAARMDGKPVETSVTVTLNFRR